MTVETFPFPADPKAVGYIVFPACLEDDPHVFFHGTAAVLLPSICKVGFIPNHPLTSVSFAKNSPLALRYACEKRDSTSPEGCVIAVRYEDLNRPGLKIEPDVSKPEILHDYTREPPPVVVGYSIVPATYNCV
jgi:hypothetical protein